MSAQRISKLLRSLGHVSGVVSVGLLGLAATACSANEQNRGEEIATSQAELSGADCAAVDADQSFDGKIDPPFITPQQYATCGDAYVVDVENLDAEYTGPPLPWHFDTVPARFSVQWGDTRITSQSVCIRSSISALIYIRDVSNSNSAASSTGTPYPGWTLLLEQTARGQWINSSAGGYCVLEVQQPTLSAAGQTFRVAARARTFGNSRKASIGTYKTVNP